MIRWRPSVTEERWLEVEARAGSRVPAECFAVRVGGWRRTGPISRLALAHLGLVASRCVIALCAQGASHSLIIAGVLLLALAQGLILGARLYASGIEEAIEASGWLCVGLGVLDVSRSASSATLALVCGIALAVAGLRLLNSFLTTLAVIAIAAWCADGLATHIAAASSAHALAFNLVATLGVLIALGLSVRTFRRPAYDRMLCGVIAGLPTAGVLWSVGFDALFDVRAAANGHGPVLLPVPLLLLVTALAALLVATGLRQRRHAPLLGAMACGVHLGWLLRAVTGLSLEAQLILSGALLLVAALAANRYLRVPRGALTALPLTDRQGPLEILQLAGAAAMTREAAPAAGGAERWTPGGGDSAGGGASGGY